MNTPADCHSMEELRRLIDQVDRQLVSMLRLRQDCIDRAAELKAAEGLPARIEARVRQVLANVRAASVARGLDPDFGEAVWEVMIDRSIGREERLLGLPARPVAEAAAEPEPEEQGTAPVEPAAAPASASASAPAPRRRRSRAAASGSQQTGETRNDG